MAKKVIIETYAAVGGPEKSSTGADGFNMGPTDAGEYAVAYCGTHRSSRYPDWSGIPWGAPLKEEGGELQVKIDGKWKALKTMSSVTKTDIEDEHLLLYGIRKVPKTWVFNDFGHKTCYIFKDKNKNAKLDKRLGEKIHGEFFHTTPEDEANTVRGLPVQLDESHGCVHLRPVDIDAMIKKGYMRKGNRVVVHKYADKAIGFTKGKGKAPFELHFYPGLKQLIILGSAS